MNPSIHMRWRTSSHRRKQLTIPRTASRQLRLASLVATLVFGACQIDRAQPTAPERATPVAPVVFVPDDTSWNSFTTEVGVMVTGDYPNWGVVEPNASRAFGFTLTRTALPGSNWGNVLAFDPTLPSNLSPDPGDYDTNLGRFEFDDSRTYGRLYTRQGQLIATVPADTLVPPLDPTLLAPPRDTGSYPRHPTNPGGPMPIPRLGQPNAPRIGSAAASAVPPSHTEGDSRRWIDFFIIGKEGRQRVRQQLVQAGGAAVTTPEGLEQFALSNGGDTFSTSLDRTTGAPKLLTRFERGQLVMRETRSYTPYGPESYALSKSQIEYFEPGSPRAVRQLRLDYFNTRLERAAR